MVLFNARLKCAEQVQHIVFSDEITLMMSDSEGTLRGVRDEALITLFGSEIYDATSDNSIRRGDFQEGKPGNVCP